MPGLILATLLMACLVAGEVVYLSVVVRRRRMRRLARDGQEVGLRGLVRVLLIDQAAGEARSNLKH